MINNPQNNKFSNKPQQFAAANKLSAQKKQPAKVNQVVDEEPNLFKYLLVHGCGFFGFCFVLAGMVKDGDRVPVLIIPILKAILFFFLGNQTLCCIVGVVLLLVYGVIYLLYKDKYFKKDEEKNS